MKHFFRFLSMMLLCTGVLAAAPAPVEINSVLAAVNGEPITLAEILPSVRAREYQLHSAYQGKQLEEKIYELRREAVDAKIDRRLMVQDFQEKNLNLPPEEIDKAFNQWSASLGCRNRYELLKRLKEAGTSEENLRREIAERLMVQVMIHRAFQLSGPPSPKEIYDRFCKMRGDLDAPGAIELGLFKLPASATASAAAEVAAALKKAPESWSDWVKRYGGSLPDGSVGRIDLPRLRPEFASALKNSLKAGAIAGPAVVTDGTYFLKVLKIFPAQKAHFEEQAAAVKAVLDAEKRELSRKKYVQELRAKAVIEYFIVPASQNKTGKR